MLFKSDFSTHYPESPVCRVTKVLLSVQFRALGKQTLCRVFSQKLYTRQILSLPSAGARGLGKPALCRVSPKQHSAKSGMCPLVALGKVEHLLSVSLAVQGNIATLPSVFCGSRQNKKILFWPPNISPPFSYCTRYYKLKFGSFLVKFAI